MLTNSFVVKIPADLAVNNITTKMPSNHLIQNNAIQSVVHTCKEHYLRYKMIWINKIGRYCGRHVLNLKYKNNTHI